MDDMWCQYIVRIYLKFQSFSAVWIEIRNETEWNGDEVKDKTKRNKPARVKEQNIEAANDLNALILVY